MANYVDDIAQKIRSAVPPKSLPHDNTSDLFRLYAVVLMCKGEDVTTEDVHNAWSAWMSRQDPAHESIVPFAELPAAVAAQDQPYVEAIKAVARVQLDRADDTIR